MGSLVIQVLQDFQVTGAPQDPLVLDLRDLQEKRVSRVSLEDLEVRVWLVPKVNQD